MNKKIVIKDPKIIGSKTVRYRTVELPQEFRDRMLEIEEEKKQEKEERRKNNVIKINNIYFKIEETDEDELIGAAEITYNENEQIIRIDKRLIKQERRIMIIRVIMHIIRDCFDFKNLDEGTIAIIAKVIDQVIEDNYL